MSENLMPSSVIANTAAKALPPLLLTAGLAGLTYAGICYALYNYQSKLIFRPLPDIIKTPAEVGLAYEDVWIPVGQDKLHGWWLPNPGAQKTLLFCHGNYGNISYNLQRILFHHSLGFSVLAFDYRGYGLSKVTESATEKPFEKSFGRSSSEFPSEQSTYADADAAWDYLVNQRQIPPTEITVCGHSMGGAIAIHLATQQPDMARLIVKSSFTTMEDAVHAKKIYNLFPIKQLLNHPFDSLSKVKNLKIPVLYVHGDQDFDVPSEFSKRLHAATPDPKQLWIAPGADHNGISATQGEAYGAVVQAFCADRQLQDIQLQNAQLQEA